MATKHSAQQAGRRIWVIVPAAGSGDRMGAALPKQYLMLGDRPVLAHTLERVGSYPLVGGIVVALSRDDPYWANLDIVCEKPVLTAVGGDQRCHSVLNALKRIEAEAHPNDWAMVHDAARPCVRLGDINGLVEALAGNPVGGLLATPVHDTMKQVNAEHYVRATLDRQDLWHALTPQMFRYQLLLDALGSVIDGGAIVTDESSAIEAVGASPLVVPAHSDNIKITRPGDLRLAEFYLAEQARGA